MFAQNFCWLSSLEKEEKETRHDFLHHPPQPNLPLMSLSSPNANYTDSIPTKVLSPTQVHNIV